MRPRHLILLSIAAPLAFGTAAFAFWGTTGAGTGSATTGTLNAPTNVTVPATSTSTVPVSWTGSTLSSGQSATGYYVTRVRNSDSSTVPACGTSPAASIAALNCDDLNVPDDTFHYLVTAVFNSWTATSTASGTVTVISADTTAPTVVIDSVSKKLLKASDTTTVTWHADENGTYSVRVDAIDCMTGTEVASGGYATQPGQVATVVSASSLTEGSNTIRVCVTDAATNTGDDTSTVIRDTIAPTVTVDSVSPALVGPSASITTVTWHAAENGTYSVRLGGTDCAGGTEIAGGSYATQPGQVAAAVNASDLNEGANTIRVCVTDAAMNTGAATGTVTKDTTGPTVTINQAVGQSDPTSGSTMNFTAAFSEAVTGFTGADVSLAGTAGATTATVSGIGATYTVSVTGVTSEGTVIATIAANGAQDGAGNGNTASTSTDNSVSYVAPAPAAPSAVMLVNGGGTGNAYIHQANRGSVNVDVILPAGSSTSDTVTLVVRDAGSAHTLTRTAAATNGVGTVGFNALDLTSFNDGTVTMTATSTSQAGKVSTATSTTSSKDTVAPTLGAITAVQTNGSNGLVSGTAGIAAGDAGTVTVALDKNATASPSAPDVQANGSYSAQISMPTKTTYMVTVTQSDLAGNVSTSTTTVTRN